MTADEIWNEIDYYERLKDNYSSEIRSLNVQTEELESLHTFFAQTQSDFSNRQQVRWNAVQEIANMPNAACMALDYADGMEKLLNGRDYEEACAGVKEAKEKIDCKIQECDRDIEACKQNIYWCDDWINYWYEQLASAEDA